MIKRLADFVFDPREPALIDLLDAQPDPELVARNAARIEEAKKRLGEKYILAKPINAPIDLGAFNPEKKSDE